MASEMLYPVMPVYLKSLGYSVFFIGLIEGIAEAVAGLSKGYFGKLSDSQGKRLPFVQWGYTLSAISKPVIGLVSSIWVIFFARTLDRLGKGIRTGARDAMLADGTTKESRGKVFGFHRSMDTLGAVAGPLIALVYLANNPGAYAQLFILAFIPGLLAIAISFLIKEVRSEKIKTGTPGFLSFLNYWKTASASYKKLAAGLLLFALVNSSDIFLLLMMKEKGATDTEVIGIYIFYNLIYALAAFPIGAFADKIGLKKMLVTGLFIFGAVYAGMAFADGKIAFLALFALYGIYAAATEGVSKALITNVCKKNETATAIGTYTAFQSICALVASTLAGWIWYSAGAEVVFIYSAVISILVAIWLYNQKIETATDE